MKIVVRSCRMTFGAMAARAKVGHLSHQKLAMIAPVNLMTDQTILRHRRVFEGIRPSLLCMAFITKIID